MNDVFLSYASDDLPRIRLLVVALEGQGFTVWWDRTIPIGKDWDEFIEQNLAEAKSVVVVWSKVSVKSQWVKSEAREGKKRGVLVPILLDEVDPPLEFRSLQSASLVGWEGNESDRTFQDLCRAVSTVVPGTMGGEDWKYKPEPPLPPRRPPRPPRFKRLTILTVPVLVVVFGTLLFIRSSRPPVVAVMAIDPKGTVPPDMCELARDKLDAALSKLSKSGQIEVYSHAQIAFLMEQGRHRMEVVKELGIDRMISGKMWTGVGSEITLSFQLVETASGLFGCSRTGMLRDTVEASGPSAGLEQMVSEAAYNLARSLKLNIPDEELRSALATRANATPDDYRLLAESMGADVGDESDEKTAPGDEPHTWWLPSPGAVYAQGPTKDPVPGESGTAAESPEAAVRVLLDRYRQALESKDIQALATVHVEMTDKMRSSLTRYFENAEQLSVQFSDVVVLVENDKALATFTRSDEFTDTRSDREVRMEIRVSTTIEKRDGVWKIRGLKQAS